MTAQALTPTVRHRTCAARLRDRLADVTARFRALSAGAVLRLVAPTGAGVVVVALAAPQLLLPLFGPLVVVLLGIHASAPGAPSRHAPLDLDSTQHCPVRPACETCAAVDDLAVATADTPVGVLCLTLCSSCADAGELPAFPSWFGAACRVGEHCEHLGVDLDEAAAARR